MNVHEFKERASTYPMQEGVSLFKRSVLSIRDGAGVIERIFEEGKYKRCLEIGTYHGISAAFIAMRCPHVTTIDLECGQIETLGHQFDRKAFWKHMCTDNIEQILVRDDAHKAEIIPTLDFDIAFIDGGKNNIAFDFDLVKRCGTVLMHDVDKRGIKEQDAVFDFVQSLPRSQVERLDIFALWRG
jgi:predicted O-methyltransferase YrrM